MQYRKFGNTDLVVSAIGFGAWAIGGGATVGSTAIGWGEADDSETEKAIKSALDKGINFFDTADIYGLGHSEEVLGKTLVRNKDAIIATKGGNVARNGNFTVDYTKEHLLQACTASLRRLRRETIDYYQLHTARLSHLQEEDCIAAVQQLQREGKIRYWGLSLNTFAPNAEADYLMKNNLGAGFQLVLNLINQKAVPLLQNAAANGYGVIARMPLQFGLLTGKFDAGAQFAHNDHRKNRLTPEVIAASNSALAPVWELCTAYNCTKTALALSYVLSYPEVSTVIPGIRTAAQVTQNTENIVELRPEHKTFIEELGRTQLQAVLQLIQQQG